MCELCDSKEGIRREDDICVCDDCNEKYPIGEWLEIKVENES